MPRVWAQPPEPPGELLTGGKWQRGSRWGADRGSAAFWGSEDMGPALLHVPTLAHPSPCVTQKLHHLHSPHGPAGPQGNLGGCGGILEVVGRSWVLWGDPGGLLAPGMAVLTPPGWGLAPWVAQSLCRREPTGQPAPGAGSLRLPVNAQKRAGSQKAAPNSLQLSGLSVLSKRPLVLLSLIHI